MERYIEKIIQEKAKTLKAKTLGYFRKESFKSEEQLAKILKNIHITHSFAESKDVVRSFPDIFELHYPTSIFSGAIGNDCLRIMRLKNPLFESDPTYKINVLYAPRDD